MNAPMAATSQQSPRKPALRSFRCRFCGHVVAVARRPHRCTVCGSTAWTASVDRAEVGPSDVDLHGIFPGVPFS